MKTSLGIWAFGPMVTRFVPGGYQPQHALMDDYEFHYPQELATHELVYAALGA